MYTIHSTTSTISRCSWLGECVVVTVCCVVCVIEYGWYVGRGDCGVCGWKDRCRDGNLRMYCHVSPILFGWFFVEASPTCFCIFVKCFFCNLFLGIFWGKRAFYSLSMNFFHFKNVLPATCFFSHCNCCADTKHTLTLLQLNNIHLWPVATYTSSALQCK